MLERFGRLDILVNNAGSSSPMRRRTKTRLGCVLNVNVSSAFRLCRAAGRHMLGAGSGKIINMPRSCRSRAASVCRPTRGEGAIAQLTKALANEWPGAAST